MGGFGNAPVRGVWFTGTPALLAAVLVLAGCQTTGSKDDEVPQLESGTVVPFTPQANTVPLNLEDGPYPTLYSGSSFATWVTPAMGEPMDGANGAMVGADTAAMAASFVVVECHLASAFADMSIGYDVVGLRGVDVYLEMPDGQRVTPSQIIVGQQLEETQRGALKAYGRTNTLLFPRRQGSITITPDLAQRSHVRLVLDTHDSLFSFTWQPIFPGTLPPPPLAQREGMKRFKAGYQAFFGKVRDVSHTFD